VNDVAARTEKNQWGLPTFRLKLVLYGGRAGRKKGKQRLVLTLTKYVTVCLYARHECMHSGLHLCIPIPMLFKSGNRIQIKTKSKIYVLFLNQNLMFFTTVHLILL
jgi:hypothetical protein